MDSMKSETVARAVLGMRRYTQVWDGARSHRSELVRSVVGVETIVEPAYSPGSQSRQAGVRRGAQVGVREYRGEDSCGGRMSELAGVRS